MIRTKLSQTFKICLALMLSVLSTNILPVASAYAATDTCSNTTFTAATGGWVKTEGLSSTTFTVPQITGYTVTQICYKASNTVVFPAVSTTVTSTVTNPGNGSIQNLSHVSVYYTPNVTTVTPTAPSVNPLCGPNNDTLILPTQTGVDYSSTGWVGGSLTVTATAQAGYVLAGQTSWTFTDVNTPCLISVTATAPSQDDECALEDDTYTIPSTTGVEYLVGGTVKAAGTYSTDDALSVTITAQAAAGYSLTGTVNWTLTFTNDECEEDKVDICHATSAVVNPYNKISVSTNAADGGGDNGDHFDEHNGPIFDPLTNVNGDDWGDIIPPIAGAHNGLNWTAQGQAIYNTRDCAYVPPVVDSCPLVPGVQTNTALCPPGQGGGGQVLGTTTTTSTTTQLPATLPATGGLSTNPFMILIASLIAYGAAYFLQGRRQLSTSLDQ